MSITRGSIESGQMCTCDNCGKLITQMVNIRDGKTGKPYTIGVDCAETFVAAKCLYNNGQATDFHVDIYSYNLCARFITEVKAGCNIVIEGWNAVITNRKEKRMQVFVSDLKKYFPEYLPN